MQPWEFEDAKNRFSEVVRRALTEGPQRVSRYGLDEVVVISAQEYTRLTSPRNLVDFMRESPLAEAQAMGEFDLQRSADIGRDIQL